MSPENKEHYQSEKKAIHLLLTEIGDEIYSTADACKTAHNIFTSHDGDTIESYYSRFYKIMNEMIRNNLTAVATMQVNVQFLQQLQPEWLRFVTIAKQHHDLDTISKGTQRDKDMQKNLTLIAKYFKKIYKPTNNNLRTFSNSRNKNVDNSPRYKNDNPTGEFGNQRTVTVAGARETVGSQVVHQTRIQYFNCKEFGHFAKECKKPKRAKDNTYHKEKMLLCKRAKKGVPLQANQVDWLEDTNEEIDEQKLEAHYIYMAKIQEVPTADSGTDTEPLEQVDSNVIPSSPDMCNNDIQTDQNAVECDAERVALANLIENLILDTEENKKILKQLKKSNASLTQELKKCKSNLEESNTTRDSCLIALQSKQTELETYKTLIDRTVDQS
ncbi:retrovirus-related pol polyprotein from transposon TNT 1-94 [Tanacetum coccineum]